MVILFREVRRCLADHGSAWINLGDSYNGIGGPGKQNGGPIGKSAGVAVSNTTGRRISGLKAKDLVGIPWKVAFALQADGWWLRGDHIWAKPNGMPESVTDRPSRGHEYVFLLTKSDRYWYDSYAVRTAPKSSTVTRLMQDVGGQAGSVRANGGRKTNGTMKAVAKQTDKQRGHSRRHAGFNDRWDSMSRDEQMEMGVNLRSVWWIPPAQCRYAHFAVMPKRVAEICILAGCPESVCETCGTPWVRDLERERKPTRPGRDTKVKGDSATEGNRDPQRHVTQYTDKGFVRACKCDPLLTRRGIVLDPFMGSDTLRSTRTRGLCGLANATLC